VDSERDHFVEAEQTVQKPRRPRAPKLRVEVTRENIEQSTTRDSSHCMIAEAVKLAFPGAYRVSVDLQTIRFGDAKKRLRYTYLTPRRAQLALVDFDQGVLPEPFTISLRNGQVTASQAAQKRNLTNSRLSKAALTVRGTAGMVPDRTGGKPPPKSGHGRIRAFGLRGLAR
jgi:hypothetical protein